MLRTILFNAIAVVLAGLFAKNKIKPEIALAGLILLSSYDLLAEGSALIGLSDLVSESGAELIGAGIVIEKGFQLGGKRARDAGIRVESLAIIESMDEKKGIVYKEE